jgi:chemotaxis regulatin CheY-phosphate phosphatase CheZ
MEARRMLDPVSAAMPQKHEMEEEATRLVPPTIVVASV